MFINYFHHWVGAYISSQRSDHHYLVKRNCVVNEKYPAQMLEVPGDLRRASAKLENPETLDTFMIIDFIVQKLYFY